MEWRGVEADEAEEPEDSGGRSLTKRTLAILVAVILVLAVALPTVVFFVFFNEPGESSVTMTHLVDGMRDTDGDFFPDDYITLEEGDHVTIRDRIQDIDTGFGGSIWMEFPYSGKKWTIYRYIGHIMVTIGASQENLSLCHCEEGDWVTLDGVVISYESYGTWMEDVRWTSADCGGPKGVPNIDLNLTRSSEDTWTITTANCSLDCKLWHFDFLLKRYGFGWDWFQGLEHGKRSMFMEFWDIDGDDCLSDGDVLYVLPEEAGDYEVILQYHSQELTSMSFHYDGP